MKTHARLALSLCALAMPAIATLLLTAAAAASAPASTAAEPIGPEGAPAVVFQHDASWPQYAQTEIAVYPEPPNSGEPAEVCVSILNTSGVSQTVTLDFGAAPFGIGLPFNPIGSRTIVVPPHSPARVCLTWIPNGAAHWCLQVILRQSGFPDQISQRNIDAWEVLTPGVPATTFFQLGNPLTTTTSIHLELKPNPDRPGWGASLSVTDLQLAPGQKVLATLVVTPPAGVPLGTRDYIVDVEASVPGPAPVLLGGFRKLDWPPVQLHTPEDPPYAQRAISVDPYPPQAGEPTHICAELRNLSDALQSVGVGFEVSQRLGLGLPFVPIDEQSVEIPGYGVIRVCTVWVPPLAGQFGVQVRLLDPQQRYLEQVGQRNLDVNEVFVAGQPSPSVIPVRNPNPITTTVHLTATRVNPLFDVWFDTQTLADMRPYEVRPVMLFAQRQRGPAPADGEPIADVEAFFYNPQTERILIGGIRKIFRPPIPVHSVGDPLYAEREITIEPYPPRAGEPTQICAELRNPTAVTQTVSVQFAVADFGIGLPFRPLQASSVALPPHARVRRCVTWVPPQAGQFCAQVSVAHPQLPDLVVRSQRNVDVSEVFTPGQWTEPFVFPVGNPSGQSIDIELASRVHLPGWQVVLTPTRLLNVEPQAVRLVTMTVRPPALFPMPADEVPIVDVEAHSQGRLIGGIRKIYRPPVPIHQPRDPIYAESEIHIAPYPPRERQPTEICAELRNPTDVTQTLTVTFGVAGFGIGLPFHDIARPITATLSPHSFQTVCVTWVPPFGGRFCARVTLQAGGREPVSSMRNMDVGETFLPGQASELLFLVGNPTTRTVTITLGLVLHQLQWDAHLSQDELTQMQPDEVRPVTLVVTPTLGAQMPPDGEPVVDVEAYIGRELIGGFRKLYHPPVPIHRPGDPTYAESEIFIDPYPVQIGQPTLLGAVVHNPTATTQRITVTFSVAHFGIGMPFSTTGILTPTLVVNVPPMGMARVHTLWVAQYRGLFCVQIELDSAGHERVWSQRNIDVGEPLRPDQPHLRLVEVRNPTTEVVTITLALISHRPGWRLALTPTVLTDMGPGALRAVSLTVQPSSWQGLADGEPIADVEAYVSGELIGGIRKIARPPIPLHKPQDPAYAESEISLTPYPVQAGTSTRLATEIMNTSEATQTIRVEFWVANFGFGIPFVNTAITPTHRLVTLGPGISQTVEASWTPPGAGNWCIQIRLKDPNGEYPEQISQRNVHVERRDYQPCQPFTRDFRLQNPTSLTVTVDIGASAVNLPPGWSYSTSITQTTLVPFSFITVTLTITPPCGVAAQAWLTPEGALDTGGANGPATIDVEGYVDGQLLGGIEVQLEAALPEWKVYWPFIRK